MWIVITFATSTNPSSFESRSLRFQDLYTTYKTPESTAPPPANIKYLGLGVENLIRLSFAPVDAMIITTDSKWSRDKLCHINVGTRAPFYQAEKIRDLVILVTLACHLREYRSSLIFLV